MTKDKQEDPTPADKAFAILKKNLNVWDLKELIGLLEVEVDRQSQKMMAEDLL